MRDGRAEVGDIVAIAETGLRLKYGEEQPALPSATRQRVPDAVLTTSAAMVTRLDVRVSPWQSASGCNHRRAFPPHVGFRHKAKAGRHCLSTGTMFTSPAIHRTFVTPPTKRSSVSIAQRLAQYPGSTEPAPTSIDQRLQLNWCDVPESPCHWRSFGSDHRLPLLLAKSMLANWNAAWAAAPSTRVGFPV
jgi:hypothetical protein